jgi:hypothetical protein
MYENSERFPLAQQLRKLPTHMYNHDVQTYSLSQTVPVTKGCFAYMFTNIGDTIARVNGMVIFPSSTPATALGDSRTIAGHELDLFMGNIDISFTGAGVDPNVEIVQLFYIDLI